jgi:hypothetical protein
MESWTRVSVGSGLLVAWACLAHTQAAYAYIDPGTGSYLFQLLMGFVLVGGLVVRGYWGKIKGFVTGIFSRGDSPGKDAG